MPKHEEDDEKPEKKPEAKPKPKVEVSESEERSAKGIKQDADRIEVDLSGEGDDDDEKEEPSPRQEKRKNRFREAQEEAARAKAEAEVYKSRVQALEREPRYQQPPPQQQGPDAHQVELDRVHQARKQLADEFEKLAKAGALTKETNDAYWTRMRELNDYEYRVQYSRNRAFEMANDPTRSPEYQKQQGFNQWFQMAHGDVLAHGQRDAIITRARGEFYTLRARGEPETTQTYDKAIQIAKKEFGLNGRPAPSEEQRARYGGATQGGGMNGSGAKTITMTKADQKLALARFGKAAKGDRNLAFKMWAKDVASQSDED